MHGECLNHHRPRLNKLMLFHPDCRRSTKQASLVTWPSNNAAAAHATATAPAAASLLDLRPKTVRKSGEESERFLPHESADDGQFWTLVSDTAVQCHV